MASCIRGFQQSLGRSFAYLARLLSVKCKLTANFLFMVYILVLTFTALGEASGEHPVREA